MLQARYDSHGIHSFEQWLSVAQQAVAMVSTAREIMDLLPPSPKILT